MHGRPTTYPTGLQRRRGPCHPELQTPAGAGHASRPHQTRSVEPVSEPGTDTGFAGDFDPAAVRRSALRVTALVGVVLLIALLTPGLGTLRDRIGDAAVGWLLVALALEALSGLSYVLMLKAIFLRGQSWWAAQRLGWSELAMGSIVPSSGVAGLALGAWVFNRVGADPKVIARRSIAFYLIKGSVNFIAVAVVGLLLFAGVGPDLSPWLTLFPALVAIAVIALVVQMPRIGPGPRPGPDARRLTQMLSTTRRTLIHATQEAGEILRRREPAVYLGAFGFWFFDNAVLWATFQAFGADPSPWVILLGYLIGQLGGLIPVPGGIGGVDGGLIGTFVLYGIPAEPAVIAVLAYRVILFWLPLLIGGVAFFFMQRQIREIEAQQAADLARAERDHVARHGAAGHDAAEPAPASANDADAAGKSPGQS
ncbi:MAG: UPF0104 family protein [Solirubrobacteraceae bacterium]|nr:UPF0104 family protein [Solirubrobacteraceae bacterium]